MLLFVSLLMTISCVFQYGEIEEMNVCDNLGDHLVGNVYVKVGTLHRTLFFFIELFDLVSCKKIQIC